MWMGPGGLLVLSCSGKSVPAAHYEFGCNALLVLKRRWPGLLVR